MSYRKVHPKIIFLQEELTKLNIIQEQLIVIGILVGTDFNPGGVKGIGPKKALSMVKKYSDKFDKLFTDAKWDEYFSVPWKRIYDLIVNMPVKDIKQVSWRSPDTEKIKGLLVDICEFSEQRVQTTLSKIINSGRQKGLGEFMQ